MSQRDFARLMDKSENEVSRWLSGTHNLTMATLCKIATALGQNIVVKNRTCLDVEFVNNLIKVTL